MRWWALVPIILLLMVVESSLLLPLSRWGMRPDLVLVFVVALGLTKGPVVGGVGGFLAGFLVDLAGGRMVGLGALVKGVLGLCVGGVSRRVFRTHMLVPVAILLAAWWIDGLLYFLGAKIFGVHFHFFNGPARSILPPLGYDAFVMLICYPLVLKLLGFIDPGGRFGDDPLSPGMEGGA